MSERERAPIGELIERWRIRPATEWDEIVGHGPQVRRLRELVAKLGLAPGERTRLGLRLGAGIVITGPPGSGKTLLARAFATALGRDVIAPPAGELDAELIGELYRALAAGAPTVVVLDEAEALIGDPDWHTTDEPAERALLAALDGVDRPEAGPVTVALTAAAAGRLSAAATRPGRLAPRLALDPPSAAERAILLAREVAGLPGAAGLDLATIAERTAGWTGAEMDGLVEEAMTRSLLEGTPGLATETMLAVVAERFVVRDPIEEDRRDDLLASRHEAGHALWAHLVWGAGAVGVVDIHDRGGTTSLVEPIMARRRDRAELRRLAAMSLAGAAAEELCFGRAGKAKGSAADLAHATELLESAREMDLPFEQDVLEDRQLSRGSEAMRRARYEAVRREAELTWDEVLERLRPHVGAIERLAEAFLAADGMTLLGDPLTAAIEAALGG
ncbi:MAG: AAA family ATPase [Candidatus Limnocylindrales bacterium]